MKIYIFLFLLITLHCSNNIMASHVAGGDLSYELIGTANGFNSYRVRLVFYRACDEDASSALNTYSIGVSSSCNLNSTTVTVVRTSTEDLGNCNIGCYQKIIYLGQLNNVPVSCSTVTLSWSIIARNSSSFYSADPLLTEFYIESQILNQIENNSSVSNATDFLACIGYPFLMELDELITDSDGDQLVFTLVPPRIDGNTPLTWISPFTFDSPMETALSGPYTLSNGVNLSFTPWGTYGNTVISILVSEYRSGILVGQSIKEFTILISPCPNAAPYFTNLPSEPIPVCVNANTCITLDFEDPNGYPVDAHASIVGVNGEAASNTTPNSIELCWTPTWDDLDNPTITVLLENQGCVNSLQTSGIIEYNLLACTPRDYCGHPCMPALGPVSITLKKDNVQVITDNCEESVQPFGVGPALWLVNNALGTKIRMTNSFGGHFYECEEFDVNGLILDLPQAGSNPYLIGWNGINSFGNIVQADPYVFEVSAWNCESEEVIPESTVIKDAQCGTGEPVILPCINNMEFLECEFKTCPEHLDINVYDSYHAGNYYAGSSINASFRLLDNGSNVKLKAGNEIIITNTVVFSSVFIAKIGDCTDPSFEGKLSEESMTYDLSNYYNQDLKNYSDSELILYPNPTTGNLTLSHSQQLLTVEVYDPLGRQLQQTAPNATTTSIDLSGQPAGIYIIRAGLEDGSTETHRVVLSPP